MFFCSPAYTPPAVPVGLKADPVLFIEFPGWFPSSSHEAPGWPVSCAGEMLPLVGGVLVGRARLADGTNVTTLAANKIKVRFISEAPFLCFTPDSTLVPAARCVVHSAGR